MKRIIGDAIYDCHIDIVSLRMVLILVLQSSVCGRACGSNIVPRHTSKKASLSQDSALRFMSWSIKCHLLFESTAVLFAEQQLQSMLSVPFRFPVELVIPSLIERV